MSAKRKMLCEECGVEMNRHAAKVVEPRTVEDARRADPVLGGIVEQVHSCPGCGRVASEH